MQKGKFIDLLVVYNDENHPNVTFDDEAIVILDAAQKSLDAGASGVGYIYSANYGQTVTIERTYFKGGWNTGTSGANQAQMVMAVEQLLGKAKYSHLQGKLHILPVTTMDYNSIPSWNEDIHIGIIYTDLKRIENYLMVGWDVLGLQDQKNNAKKPYAIGGKIANMS
jgi:hypothetical protein